MTSLSNMLRGISGEFEITRVVGAAGASAYILCANGFVAWNVLHGGQVFDVTAYCLAFPTGLGVAVGSIAGAAAVKDRNVAKARLTGAQADAADAANITTPTPTGDPQ